MKNCIHDHITAFTSFKLQGHSQESTLGLIRGTPDDPVYAHYTICDGYYNLGMKPSDFPQFREGEREDKFRSFLREQFKGASDILEFNSP